jgi:lycopene beta-cyclase
MSFEGILVGGGLQSALIALAVLQRHPHARLALVEREHALGGVHTWSFHAGDLGEAMARVVEPLVVRRWPGYEVAFPGLARRLEQPYASISSGRLAEVVEAALARAPNARLVRGVAATHLHAHGVQLATGEWLAGTQVIDARGPEAGAAQAFQKFVGLELELMEAPARERPVVMDATVAQHDGFRFVYTLPLAAERWLIEDTYYSDSPALDEPLLTRRVLDYARAQGLRVSRVLRTERGVLPLPLELPPPALPGDAGALVAGYRGGWFHPTTGYSLPCAARLAELVADSWPAAPAPERLAALQGEQREQARFATLLNRLLFRACAPEQRWRVLERFYRLPEPSIARFYALQTTRADRARILLGAPPRGVSLGRALVQLANVTR